MTEVEQRFAERVRAVRKELGWSAQRVADKAGMTRVALAKAEVGKRGLSLGEAVALAEAVGVELADLITPGEFFVNATVSYGVQS